MSTPEQVKEAEVMPAEGNGKKSKAIAKREQAAVAIRTPDINDLMAQAVATGNTETIKFVFDLRQELKREAAKEAFLDALSQFQATVPTIPKAKKGYGYWYAPLGVIESKISKAMEASGLSKRWRQEEGDGGVKMICVVSHRAGHSEETPIGPVPWNLLEQTERMNGLQHRSAVITYLQRYTLIGALGLATADEDPDGVIPEETKASRPPVTQPKAKPTAQKAAAAKATPPGERPQLEPAGEGEASIDAGTIKGFTAAMERATLSNDDFVKRFPAMTGIEQIKDTPAQKKIMLSWLGDPQNK